VSPAARGFGPRLTRQVLKHGDVTLIDLTPMPHTRRFIEACGFRRYTQGQFACLPALRLKGLRAQVRPYAAQDAERLADAGEAALMADHAAYGCLSLVCETREVRCAGPLGRYLLRRRAVMTVIDSDGAAPGLAGRFIKDRWPRYYLGPHPPRANDLAYTEAVVLGV
jgi:hypothetical protein